MSIFDKIRGGAVSYSTRGRRNVPPIPIPPPVNIDGFIKPTVGGGG